MAKGAGRVFVQFYCQAMPEAGALQSEGLAACPGADLDDLERPSPGWSGQVVLPPKALETWKRPTLPPVHRNQTFDPIQFLEQYVPQSAAHLARRD
ncbi:hypothetical protein GCM10009678_47510 [Actinomadura kijaniata]